MLHEWMEDWQSQIQDHGSFVPPDLGVPGDNSWCGQGRENNQNRMGNQGFLSHICILPSHVLFSATPTNKAIISPAPSSSPRNKWNGATGWGLVKLQTYLGDRLKYVYHPPHPSGILYLSHSNKHSFCLLCKYLEGKFLLLLPWFFSSSCSASPPSHTVVFCRKNGQFRSPNGTSQFWAFPAELWFYLT